MSTVSKTVAPDASLREGIALLRARARNSRRAADYFGEIAAWSLQDEAIREARRDEQQAEFFESWLEREARS